MRELREEKEKPDGETKSGLPAEKGEDDERPRKKEEEEDEEEEDTSIIGFAGKRRRLKSSSSLKLFKNQVSLHHNS